MKAVLRAVRVLLRQAGRICRSPGGMKSGGGGGHGVPGFKAPGRVHQCRAAAHVNAHGCISSSSVRVGTSFCSALT